LCIRYYGQGAGGFGNVCGHGETGMTSPLLLILSMQFFSISDLRSRLCQAKRPSQKRVCRAKRLQSVQL